MTLPLPAPASASERLTKLHEVAGLLASLSGERTRAHAAAIDVEAAYDAGSSLARARFDDLALRANMVASAGIASLLAAETSCPSATALLAEAIEAEIAQLESLLTGA